MGYDGWIKIHRCIRDSAVWKASNSKQRDILINLLLLASHKPNKWFWKGQSFSIEPGQLITSLESIKEQCSADVSTQTIRTALLKFEKLEFLTSESTKQGRLITIENWSLYQGDTDIPNKATNRQLTNNQQLSRMKECKEHNMPTFEQVNSYATVRGRCDLSNKFFDYYENGDPPWTDANKKAVKNWKQKFITWESRNVKPITEEQRGEL